MKLITLLFIFFHFTSFSQVKAINEDSEKDLQKEKITFPKLLKDCSMQKYSFSTFQEKVTKHAQKMKRTEKLSIIAENNIDHLIMSYISPSSIPSDVMFTDSYHACSQYIDSFEDLIKSDSIKIAKINFLRCINSQKEVQRNTLFVKSLKSCLRI